MSELRLEMSLRAASLTLSHHRLQVRPSRPKAWKVRAQTAPASLSCVPRAAFTWRTSTSAPDFFLPSIHQNRFMLSTTPPTAPQPRFWRSTMTSKDCAYSISVSEAKSDSWYCTRWLMVVFLLVSFFFISFENISLTLWWCSVVCLGLVVWIPEIFHYLSRWCF